MQPGSSAGDHTKDDKCGKICNRCQAQKKNATYVERGKTCNRCEALEKTVLRDSKVRRLILFLIGWKFSIIL